MNGLTIAIGYKKAEIESNCIKEFDLWESDKKAGKVFFKIHAHYVNEQILKKLDELSCQIINRKESSKWEKLDMNTWGTHAGESSRLFDSVSKILKLKKNGVSLDAPSLKNTLNQLVQDQLLSSERKLKYLHVFGIN